MIPIHSSTLYTKITPIINKHSLIIFPLAGKAPHPKLGKTRQFWNTPIDAVMLREMLEDPAISSYAVLCGQISKNLFVLDFDKLRRYRAFAKAFPKLAQNTFTVRTRRGYHVYLRAMDTMPRTQHLGDMDLLGEGSYVVGPQSLVDKTTYKIIIDAPIQIIDDINIQEIINELKQSPVTASSNVRMIDDLVEYIPTGDSDALREYQIRMYWKYGQTSKSRNIGLHRAASISASRGISYDQTIATLLPIHTQANPYNDHRRESQEQRSAEGIKTITSAYKNQVYGTSALQISRMSAPETGLMPTALREALLQAWGRTNKQGVIVNGSTVPGRLIEALLVEGIQPGTTITYRDICQIGKRVSLSSKSIFHAMRGKLSQYNGKSIFQRLSKYSYSQKTLTHVGDYDNRTINEHNNTFSKGRKTENYFVMPSIEHLCSIFDILAQSWDAIPFEALKTPKAYRMALHEQYIRRVNPETSATYNGNRLGCHSRTTYRYDKELGVKTIPIYGYEPLSWQNVDNEDLYGQPRSNDVTPGQWLQRIDGKRYPAIKGIALKLLKRGDVAVACKRLASRRILGDVSLILGDIIWRRLDKEKSQSDTYSSEHVLPAFVLPERSSRASTSSDNSPKHIVRRNHDIEAQNDTRTANFLTLVKGIGERRAGQLNDLDIISLDDLIAADPSYILSNLHHGGYLTASGVIEWQYEAKVILGLEERRQSDINMERNKARISNYTTAVKKIIKFIKKSFDLLDETFGYATLPIPENDLIRELTIVSTQLKSREGRWYVSLINGSAPDKLNPIFTDFFNFYEATITRMDNLSDYQLDEYGFGSLQFWKTQSRWLAHYTQLVIDATADYQNGDKNESI